MCRELAFQNRARSRNRILAALFLGFVACSGFEFVTIAKASTHTIPFGQEKVQTREFRNKDVERAFNTPVKATRGPGAAHGKKGRKGHKGHKH